MLDDTQTDLETIPVLKAPPIVRLMMIAQSPVKRGGVIGWLNYSNAKGSELILASGEFQWVPA